jgi:hypothetical protein
MSDQKETVTLLVEDPPANDPTVCRYPPEFFVDKLTPYTKVYETVQGLLFFRRPIAFALIVLHIELVFILVRVFDLGFLSVAAAAFAIYYTSRLVYGKLGGIILPLLFPPIDRGAESESNRIYPLLSFCQRLSHIVSLIVEKHEAARTGAPSSLVIGTAVHAAAFLLFGLTGTFWPIVVVVHLLLFVPGVVMHPKVFPYTRPYFVKFARAINCPYCTEE